MSEKAYEAVELARKTGKVRKGCNEVTKEIERGTPKLVIIARDVQPPEITMHLPLLCKEKDINYVEVDSKEQLGAAVGLPVGTAAVAIIQEGESKDILKQLKSE
ncbi:MAG: 50S ribosomal protein L7ae [Nanoarchaeota archaeon]|nr:50S ribosomal protein L7ae [DPANN group archaeon]MBL7116424.1 50S ribosomal protein L7ae [Nanoarchaeota archaeon]